MNWPPMLLHLRIPTDQGFVGLWLPWFLVYPILLALMLVALPIGILICVLSFSFRHIRRMVTAGVLVWVFLFNMRGLSVDVQTAQHKMLISFV